MQGTRSPYGCSQGVFQREDGEMDLNVELQFLGNGVKVSGVGGNVRIPELEEDLHISIIKGR